MIFFIKTDKTEEKSLEIKIIPTKLKGEINIPPSIGHFLSKSTENSKS